MILSCMELHSVLRKTTTIEYQGLDLGGGGLCFVYMYTIRIGLVELHFVIYCL